MRSRMEKLIELLKESGKADEICPTWIDIRKQYFDAGNITRADRMMYEYLCSKYFWFIKRLVDNDKIDLNKDAFISLASELWCTAKDEKIVLMVLSISDTPIEDLISYLK